MKRYVRYSGEAWKGLVHGAVYELVDGYGTAPVIDENNPLVTMPGRFVFAADEEVAVPDMLLDSWSPCEGDEIWRPDHRHGRMMRVVLEIEEARPTGLDSWEVTVAVNEHSIRWSHITPNGDYMPVLGKAPKQKIVPKSMTLQYARRIFQEARDDRSNIVKMVAQKHGLDADTLGEFTAVELLVMLQIKNLEPLASDDRWGEI